MMMEVMTHRRQKTPGQLSDLSGQFPAKEYRRLIMRDAYIDDGFLAFQFAEAGDRLAKTYRGQAPDDSILLPCLFLYRHAIELALKEAIRYATGSRRDNGDTEPGLDRETVAGKLRSRALGHQLGALTDELDSHLEALNLPLTPAETRQVIAVLQLADPEGMSFRYSDELLSGEQRLDFPGLHQAVKGVYEAISATIDMLDYYSQSQSEMRADYEADMQALFGE